MIRFLTVSAIVCGLLAAFSPANAAEKAQEPAVSVNHEWGKLTEVVIGRGDTLRMPGYSKYVDFIYDPQYLEKMKQNGGKDAMDLEPELTKKVIAQIDNLADVLQKRGIKVHRPAPLDPAQSQFMDYVQKGRMQLYARDPMLVIGNNVFETALKVPMRAKERFGLRPILRELFEKRGAKFVAMPMPDPSFPDDGIYIEGGDVQLNGYEIYVGNSGRGSSKAGIAWLQQQLGPKYKVIEVPLDSAWEHLDCVLALLKPGLGLIYRPGFKGELPEAIRDWGLCGGHPGGGQEVGRQRPGIGRDHLHHRRPAPAHHQGTAQARPQCRRGALRRGGHLGRRFPLFAPSGHPPERAQVNNNRPGRA